MTKSFNLGQICSYFSLLFRQILFAYCNLIIILIVLSIRFRLVRASKDVTIQCLKLNTNDESNVRLSFIFCYFFCWEVRNDSWFFSFMYFKYSIWLRICLEIPNSRDLQYKKVHIILYHIIYKKIISFLMTNKWLKNLLVTWAIQRSD